MSGHFVSDFPESGSVDYSDQSTNLDETAVAELQELAGRYPHPRSALLPMLHLVQSYDGRISPRGIELCAEILGITTAQVSGLTSERCTMAASMSGTPIHMPRRRWRPRQSDVPP